jgi:hypothetical protein
MQLATPLTATSERLALYTISTPRNILSSSGGGRFDRDQAEATFCPSISPLRVVWLGQTYTDNACELVHVELLSLYEVYQRVRLPRFSHR